MCPEKLNPFASDSFTLNLSKGSLARGSSSAERLNPDRQEAVPYVEELGADSGLCGFSLNPDPQSAPLHGGLETARVPLEPCLLLSVPSLPNLCTPGLCDQL